MNAKLLFYIFWIKLWYEFYVSKFGKKQEERKPEPETRNFIWIGTVVFRDRRIPRYYME